MKDNKMTAGELATLKDLLERKKKGEKLPNDEFKKLLALKQKYEESGKNDPSWWNQYPELTKDVINFMFNFISGTKLKYGFDNGARITDPSYDFTIPGVMAFHYSPTVGKCDSANSAANAQFRAQWLEMHRKYRGIGTYEYSDLGISEIAIVDVFRQIAEAERIYGVINNYKLKNRNVPYALLAAFKLATPNSVDLADYRYQINRIIAKAKSLCLPNSLKLLDEAVQLGSNVFKDADSARASLYVFETDKYMKYDPTSLTTGGCITRIAKTNFNNGTRTLPDIITDLNAQIDALLADSDIARICSDVLAAFEENAVAFLHYMDEDYVCEPVYDHQRLMQIHNAKVANKVVGAFPTQVATDISAMANSTAFREAIVQENGQIYCNYDSDIVGPMTLNISFNTVAFDSLHHWDDQNAGLPAIPGATILDYDSDDPGLEDKLELTRMTIAIRSYKESTKYYNSIDAFGTVLITNVLVYTAVDGVVGAGVSYSGILGPTAPQATLYEQWDIHSKFDWAPFKLAIKSGTVGADSGYTYSILGDVDNPTVIGVEDLKRVHDVCMLSICKVTNFIAG